MKTATQELYALATDWINENDSDSRDFYPFGELLDLLFFHAELRFFDYSPGDRESPFPVRLLDWLSNVGGSNQKKTMLKSLKYFQFLDSRQVLALHRDAYKRIIASWLWPDVTRDLLLSPDYERNLQIEFAEHELLSITESFWFSDFSRANNRLPIRKPKVLGENPAQIQACLQTLDPARKGAIVLEDFVGSGDQSRRALSRLALRFPQWRILFLPLVMLEQGFNAFKKDPNLVKVDTHPALVIPYASCLRRSPQSNESKEFRELRKIVETTKSRVCEKSHDLDEQPKNAFGYKSCGAFFATIHNVPNNTIPLVHHNAPNWRALFSRTVHPASSKDGLR